MYTNEDFRPGKPTHNANVFLHLWRRDEVGVIEETGEFYDIGESSAGTQDFDALLDLVGQFDGKRKLSKSDRFMTVVMLYRIAPRLTWWDGNERSKATA